MSQSQPRQTPAKIPPNRNTHNKLPNAFDSGPCQEDFKFDCTKLT